MIRSTCDSNSRQPDGSAPSRARVTSVELLHRRRLAQMAISRAEGLELSESPGESWSGGKPPGRLRFQSFRPNHPEPVTDAVIGQGKCHRRWRLWRRGLPYPSEVLQLWGGTMPNASRLHLPQHRRGASRQFGKEELCLGRHRSAGHRTARRRL